MAESGTPSGDEQYRIVKELLREQSNTDTQEQYLYVVSTCWINKWMHYVTHFVKAVYPGKLTISHGHGTDDSVIHLEEFCGLNAMRSKALFTNVWVRETIWCKWVQWYGVDDGHVLDRCTRSTTDVWPNIPISLKDDMGARVGHTSKVFNVREKCGYIELQLRRIFGVTHDTETQLLLGNMGIPLVLDRAKALMHYSGYDVRYYTGFLSLSLYRN